MALYGFKDREVAIILRDFANGKLKRVNDIPENAPNGIPPVILVKTPSGGIPKTYTSGSDQVLGKAECDVVETWTDDTGGLNGLLDEANNDINIRMDMSAEGYAAGNDPASNFDMKQWVFNFGNSDILEEVFMLAVHVDGLYVAVNPTPSTSEIRVTSASGIPARSGVRMGKASDTSLIEFSQVGSDYDMVVKGETPVPFVYNPFQTSIAASTYIVVTYIDGLRIVTAEDCP